MIIIASIIIVIINIAIIIIAIIIIAIINITIIYGIFRNDIPLPEQLPPCLQPVNLRGAVIARHTHQQVENRNLFFKEKVLLVVHVRSTGMKINKA